MKRFYLAMAGLLALATASAQGNLLDEDFTSAGQAGGLNAEQYYAEWNIDGWSAEEFFPDAALPNRWCLSGDGYSTTPNYYAYIDYDYTLARKDALSALYTPAMTLDGNYRLAFSWYASPMGVGGTTGSKKYHMMVYVCPADKTWREGTLIWDWLDEDMLLESGVQPTDYGFYTVPWVGWTWYNSTVDLSQFQGQNVKVAFIYEELTTQTNLVKLDNIRVEPAEVITEPIAQASIGSWDFGEVYIGSKMHSDVFTLSNVGKAGLHIESVECPDGFSLLMDRDMAEVDLKKNEYMQMQITYAPELTSAASGEIKINVNGQGVSIPVTATKKMLADDAVFEGFEGEAFPPAGWRSSKWTRSAAAIEGEYAAMPNAYYQEANYLVTPRIDGTKGECTIEFSYADLYSGEQEGGADTTVKLEWSSDGGMSWETVDVYDYEDEANYNTIQRVSFSRSAASNNCYWRWTWSLDYYDSEYGAEASLFYLDAVVLNNLYGAGNRPEAVSAATPQNGATDIYHRDVTLSWEPVQFAQGYRLYVGTDAEATNVLNGLDLGNTLSYTFASPLAFATTYNWKVVPYNAAGEAEGAATWHFTTIADPTVAAYPYFQGFDEAVPPMGWNATADGYTRWSRNEINPYDGKASAFAHGGGNDTRAILTTPDFVVSEPLTLTFFWGDDVAIDLLKDDTGAATNNTTGSDGISTMSFEISVDNGEWTRLALLSDKTNPYWIRERFDLAAYQGHTVAFRWVYDCLNYYKASGVCIDYMQIQPNSEVKLSFNSSGWNTGKLNNDDNVSTLPAYVLYNDGTSNATIQAVEFSSPVFSSSLQAGDVIEPGKTIVFSLGADASKGDAGDLRAVMTVRAGGQSAEFNLAAQILPADTRFYGFEWEENGTLTPAGFTTVDVDKMATWTPLFWQMPHKSEPMAFMVLRPNTIGVDYPPHTASGDQMLIAFGRNGGGATDDWLIADPVVATSATTFEFSARNYEGKDNVGGGELSDRAVAGVYVCLDPESTNVNDYTLLESYQLEYPEDEEYTTYSVDLSAYAGKAIRVALRNQTSDWGFAYLYDDLTFNHIGNAASLDNVSVDNAGTVEYYNLQGMRVEGSLAPGIYLRRTAAGTVKIRVQ